jgi:hypothetical protein
MRLHVLSAKFAQLFSLVISVFLFAIFFGTQFDLGPVSDYSRSIVPDSSTRIGVLFMGAGSLFVFAFVSAVLQYIRNSKY